MIDLADSLLAKNKASGSLRETIIMLLEKTVVDVKLLFLQFHLSLHLRTNGIIVGFEKYNSGPMILFSSTHH